MGTRTGIGLRTQSSLAISPLAVTRILAGIVGGLLFAMWMMVEGLFDEGFFAAPTSIWAFFAGPSAYHPKDLALVPLFLGVMGHMMNSIIFALILLRIGSLGATGAVPTLTISVAKALLVMTVMFGVVLPLSPNGGIVYSSAPLWSWIVGHVMYGLGVWLVAWRRGAVPR